MSQHTEKQKSDALLSVLSAASESTQEGWGSSGDGMALGTGQWGDEDGSGMWSNATPQESSWGSAPKKGLQKVCVTSKCTHGARRHTSLGALGPASRPLLGAG